MNRNRSNLRRSGLSLLSLVALVLTLSAGVFAAPAASAAPASQSQGIATITVPANGTVTIKARGFCLDFGKPFPTGNMTPTGLGGDQVRGALNYAIEQGYADTNAEQVQLAIWYLRDNTWHSQDNATAQQIVQNANSGTIPTGTGTSLADAVSQGSVTVSATFVPQSADAFYGDADVQIKNNTAQELTLYMPIGVQFTAGPSGEFQDLLAYQLTAAQVGTPTAGSTVTAGATTTATAAATGTVSGTSTVSATGTAVGTSTVSATGTAVETTTPAATGTVAETTTPAVTETVAPIATTAVATPEATATVEATAVPTIESTSTPLPAGNTLPATGESDGLLLTALMLAAVGLIAGLGFRLMHSARTR
jgi:LPXTG-motif cell wall-anchored protein